MHFVSLKMHLQNTKDKQKKNSQYLSKSLRLTECEKNLADSRGAIDFENKSTFLAKDLET